MDTNLRQPTERGTPGMDHFTARHVSHGVTLSCPLPALHATAIAENQAEWRPRGCRYTRLPQKQTDSHSRRISMRRPFIGWPAANFRAGCPGLQIRPE